jgi:hypothetical protein
VGPAEEEEEGTKDVEEVVRTSTETSVNLMTGVDPSEVEVGEEGEEVIVAKAVAVVAVVVVISLTSTKRSIILNHHP